MAVFTIQAPDGRKIKIQAADEATALRGAQEWAAANPKQASGPAIPPAGLKPGSKEYAIWARDQAIAGNKLPQVSPTPLPPQQAEPNTDIGSKLFAGAGSFIEGVPVAGPTLIDWAKQGRAAVQGMTPEQVGQEFDTAKAANPISSAIGGIGGAVATLAPLGMTSIGGKLLGASGSLPSQIGFGMGSGGLISGADTLARGGSMEDAAGSALLGTALGGVFPTIGGIRNALAGKGAQAKAITNAIADAPSSAELKTAASQMFQAVDNAGVTVEPQAFQQMVIDLAKKARADRINPTLDPKAYAAFEELGGIMGEVASGRPLTLSELHNMRQIAQKAAISAEGRDAMFANRIVEALDDFITKPGATTTANGQASGNQLLEAIGTWGRARRVSLVEEAIGKAQNAASGFENGLRVEFRKLLNNPKTSKLFTNQEREAIERVVRGNAVSNLAKLAGMFGFNIGGSGSANVVGGSLGLLLGGPVGFAAGAGARKLSEKLTGGAAERAAKVVATPNIPQLPPRPMPQALLPPAVFPLEVTRKREPLQITVRGGANS